MSRIYDTIESVSNNRSIFHCFLQKCHTWDEVVVTNFHAVQYNSRMYDNIECVSNVPR